MDHHSAAAEDRSASEIMADARLLQARHASAARWLRDAALRLGGEPGERGERRLTVH